MSSSIKLHFENTKFLTRYLNLTKIISLFIDTTSTIILTTTNTNKSTVLKKSLIKLVYNIKYSTTTFNKLLPQFHLEDIIDYEYHYEMLLKKLTNKETIRLFDSFGKEQYQYSFNSIMRVNYKYYNNCSFMMYYKDEYNIIIQYNHLTKTERKFTVSSIYPEFCILNYKQFVCISKDNRNEVLIYDYSSVKQSNKKTNPKIKHIKEAKLIHTITLKEGTYSKEHKWANFNKVNINNTNNSFVGFTLTDLYLFQNNQIITNTSTLNEEKDRNGNLMKEASQCVVDHYYEKNSNNINCFLYVLFDKGEYVSKIERYSLVNNNFNDYSVKFDYKFKDIPQTKAISLLDSSTLISQNYEKFTIWNLNTNSIIKEFNINKNDSYSDGFCVFNPYIIGVIYAEGKHVDRQLNIFVNNNKFSYDLNIVDSSNIFKSVLFSKKIANDTIYGMKVLLN